MFKKIMLLVITVILMGIISELFLRHIDGLKTYSEKNGYPYSSYYNNDRGDGLFNYAPNIQIVNKRMEFCYLKNTNSDGFIDNDWQIKKNNAYRIMCFGDSFTEGLGAPIDSSYPKLLHNILDSVEVMNAGVAGSDPIYEYKIFESTMKYKPDIAIFMFNESDVSDIIVRGGFERFDEYGNVHYRKSPWFEKYYEKSFLIRAFVHGGLRMNWLLMTSSRFSEECKKSYKIIDLAIDSIYTLSKANNIRCIFVFNPLQGANSIEPINYAKSKGYEIIALSDYFKLKGIKGELSKQYYWKYDLHNNSKGYSIISKGVADYLRLKHVY